MLPVTLPLGISLPGSVLQTFFFCQGQQREIFCKFWHLWTLLISNLNCHVLFLALLWPTRTFCSDPLIPSIFMVSDHINYKCLGLCHTPGIILFDSPFSSVPVYWKYHSRYILQLHQPLCGWIMLMTHVHTVNDYFHSGLSTLLTLSQFSPHLTANLFISLYVPDLQLHAVKFNLIFIASLLKTIRFLLYDILSFFSTNVDSQICLINYFY